MVHALASFLDDAPRSTRSTPRGVTGIASAPKMGNWITQVREIEKPVAQMRTMVRMYIDPIFMSPCHPLSIAMLSNQRVGLSTMAMDYISQMLHV